MFTFVVVALLFAYIAVVCTDAQIQTMIPLNKDSHSYHRGNAAAKTKVEFFIDLTCR